MLPLHTMNELCVSLWRRLVVVFADDPDPCMEMTTSSNRGSFMTPQYPTWFSTHDCQCSLVALNDLDLKFEVQLEEKDHEDDNCEVQMLRYRRKNVVLTCPANQGQKAPHSAYFTMYAGENITLTLRNSKQKFIKLRASVQGEN